MIYNNNNNQQLDNYNKESSSLQQQQQQQQHHKCQTITPTIDYLNNTQILTDVLCTVPNCNEIFSNVSALNLHLKKVHKLELTNATNNNEYLNTTTRTRAQRLNENCKCKYYCPANNCKYNYKIGNGARYLPSFHSLKIHFIRIHGEKLHSCSKCSRKFSIKSEMNRHEEKCGQLFKCSCGCPFSTVELLLKHAQQQSHCIPPYNELLKTTTTTKSNISNNDNTIEPICKKQATIKLKPLKPIVPSNNSSPSIIIINNIASASTPNSQSNTSIENLILNQANTMTTTTSSSSSNTTTRTIDSKQNLSFNLFKLPYLESCQRSLGCQTQIINDTNKIETASQTPILNIYHVNTQNQLQITNNNENYEIFKYYETQQTQTSNLFNNELNYDDNNSTCTYHQHQFDASTSPLNTLNDDAIINDDQFWAEISTQTFLSAFEHNNFQNQQEQQQQTAFTNTNFIQTNTFNCDEQHDSQILSNNREMQTCDITLNTQYTQTSQSNVKTDTDDLDFIDTIILNNHATTETQTNNESININEQFDNLMNIQTNSTQTQTQLNEYLVDNITQTPYEWDFNISDDDLLFLK